MIRKSDFLHENMPDVQGGKSNEHNHLTDEEYEWFANHFANIALKPVNLVPSDGELNVYQYPEFIGTEYIHPASVPMYGVELEVYSDSAMTNPICSEIIITSLTSFRSPIFENLIQVTTTYYWRLRYIDDHDIKGVWSDITSFTTASAFEPTVILRPNIIYPTETAKVSPIDPLLISTPFGVVGATDTHESSDWQIGTHANFDTILAESLNDTVNKTSIILSGFDLSGNNGFYSRVRHNATISGASQWSPIKHALLKEFYDGPLIGVMFSRSSSSAKYVGNWINEQGNVVGLKSDYFNNHPIYVLPEVSILGQSMIYIPPVYVKCDYLEDADVYRYWISPIEFDGSYLHPAFANCIGGLYIGKYLGGVTSDSGNAGLHDGNTTTNPVGFTSLPDRYPVWTSNYKGENINEYVAYYNTRVDSDHDGWHIDSIYDYSLRELLMMIEYKMINFSSKVSGYIHNRTIRNDDPVRNKWRSIVNPYQTNYGDPFGVSQTGADAKKSYMLYGFSSYENRNNTKIRNALIGYPTNLTANKTIKLNVGLNTLINGNRYYSAYNIDKFITGFDQDLGFDLNLLFLSAGEGPGFNAVASTLYGSGETASIPHMIFTYLNNSMLYEGLGLINASIYPMGSARICKWTV